jgi:DNA-binding GntR family transcriptional regulator
MDSRYTIIRKKIHGAPMKTLTLTASITEYLKNRIITGELAPGQKLNEISLTSELDVSSAPLREAFRILENEYLVVSIPRKGCFVTELSMEDCREIYQARETLECSAIDLLKAKNIRELPGVAAVVVETEEHLAVHSPDNPGPVSDNPNPFPLFHIKLVEATGNEWLLRLYKSISATLARYQFMCYVHGMLDQTQKEHEQILDAIKRGAYGEAKKTLKAHINSFLRLIKERLD